MKLIQFLLLWVFAFWAGLLVYDTAFPPLSTLMMARGLTGEPLDRRYVPLKRISPHLVRAVIAAEDAKFCTHRGVDWDALHDAVEDVVDPDGPSHGGSTITMQTTKNLFLWMGYSYVRKPVEIPWAMLLDALWGKRRVMEAYLNIAEFGEGIFGAEAASRHYFGKSAAALSPREAAQLAAVLPSPRRRNARNPSAGVRRYAASIEARMGSANRYCVR